MNCLRSLEYIKQIDAKYKKYGLDTILIHPPEWEFEKNVKNIITALKKLKINFPIIIDRDKKIIKKLKINFWPTQVLMKDAKVIYKHIGEGNYKSLESKIIKFLKIKSNEIFNEEPEYCKFPTLYCGKRKYGKIKRLHGNLKFGIVYINGKWIQNQEYIKSVKNSSSLTILTKGKIINFVANSLNKKPAKVDIKVNNKSIKIISINRPQLYNLLKFKKDSTKRCKLTLTTSRNLAIYSFSFQ